MLSLSKDVSRCSLIVWKLDTAWVLMETFHPDCIPNPKHESCAHKFTQTFLNFNFSICQLFGVLFNWSGCLQDYFGECSEGVIKDNMVIVYELLEEMLDNGFPLATESNVLKEMIRPPTILRSVVNTLTGEQMSL